MRCRNVAAQNRESSFLRFHFRHRHDQLLLLLVVVAELFGITFALLETPRGSCEARHEIRLQLARQRGCGDIGNSASSLPYSAALNATR